MSETRWTSQAGSLPHSIAQNAIEWGTLELCGPPAQAGRQPAELITSCLDDLQVFCEGEKRLDDLTLLAIRRRV
ncbi:MAG TPA: hypothetical protein VFA40_14840 [Terriglobales bacterium]|nr:hypothetical protein [Terriglobales bacterium]